MSKKAFMKPMYELLLVAGRYVADQVEQCKAEEFMGDITLSQATYLKEIGEMGNPALSELAVRMKHSKPSVTIAISKLEAKGYVQKIQSDDDRRLFHVHLTDKGNRFHDMSNRIKTLLISKVSAALTETELSQLVVLLRKILKQ